MTQTSTSGHAARNAASENEDEDNDNYECSSDDDNEEVDERTYSDSGDDDESSMHEKKRKTTRGKSGLVGKGCLIDITKL